MPVYAFEPFSVRPVRAWALTKLKRNGEHAESFQHDNQSIGGTR